MTKLRLQPAVSVVGVAGGKDESNMRDESRLQEDAISPELMTGESAMKAPERED